VRDDFEVERQGDDAELVQGAEAEKHGIKPQAAGPAEPGA
jgi:hypothetical protein